ncbi:hypothetical protein ACFLZZ_03005 [Nanoarchaeota archaeon]
MVRKFNKKGQSTIEFPFQMLFSLILIAVFLYAAFTGINYFLERADQIKIGQFVLEIKAEVNEVWQTAESEQDYTAQLPSKIEVVCFGDLSSTLVNLFCPDFELYRRQALIREANMLLCPPVESTKVGTDAYYKIDCEGKECLKIEQDLGVSCIPVENGKLSLTLSKDLESPTVSIN